MKKNVKNSTERYKSVLLKSKEQRRGTPQMATQLIREQKQSED